MPGNPKQDIPFPDDFKSEKEYVEWVREQREDDIIYDKLNRDRGEEDSQFAAGYQWLQEDVDRRKAQQAPTLTFNRAFPLLREKFAARAKIRVGPSIKPTSAGEKYDDIAAIREGLIRNIERVSDIETVDRTVSQNQLIANIGCYEVAVDFADADAFTHDIFFRGVFDPFSILFDRLSTEPTGRDARHAMRETYLDIEDFKRAYPKADTTSIDSVTSRIWSVATQNRVAQSGWLSNKSVRIATVWRVRERKRMIAMLDNGDILEVPEDVDPQTYAVEDGQGGFSKIVVNPSTGQPVLRDSPVKYTEGVVTNGVEILSGPFELPVDRVPLVRVPAWSVPIGDRVERFGIISFAKDPIRFHNYLRSDRAERIVYRNRAAFTANQDEIAGREKEWANAHLARGKILVHTGPSGGGPRPVDPPTVDSASVLESQASVEDILEIFDIRGRQLGTGKTPPAAQAVDALKELSDDSNAVFDAGYFAAKKELYRIANQLIPHVYDTPRLIKVLGDDERLQDAAINDPDDPESADITIGKYAVDINTGPSSATRRAQAISFLETSMNAAPEIVSVVFDKLVELHGFQGAEQIAKRWRERVGLQDERDTSPEEEAAKQQQEAQQQALQQAAMQFEIEMKQAELESKKAEIAVKEADAAMKAATVDSEQAQADERRVKAEADLRIADAKVEELEARRDFTIAQTNKALAEADNLESTNPKGDTNSE